MCCAAVHGCLVNAPRMSQGLQLYGRQDVLVLNGGDPCVTALR